MSLVEDAQSSGDPELGKSLSPRRRRGRPASLPIDRSDMSSRYYDHWARTSWLMATCRTLGPYAEHADRAAFVHALQARGFSADLSRVSRWESGHQLVPFTALRAYEGVLRLPVGALVSAQRQLCRGGEAGNVRPERVQFGGRSDRAPDTRALELLERATGGDQPLHGGEWLELANELDRFELVLLSQRTWSVLCNRLVNELARTTSVDQLRRYEALTTLLGHPTAQRHVLHSLGLWLTDEHVQVVTPMITLLQHLSDPAASTLVLRLLDSDSQALSQGAIQVAAAKLAHGHFSEPAALALVEQHAIRSLITAGRRRSVDVLDLATHLPDDVFGRVQNAIKDTRTRTRLIQTRQTSCLTSAEVSRAVSRQVATQVQAMTPSRYVTEPDQMLQRLVSETLFHVSGHRRRLAAHLLGLSPYGSAVADCFVALANSDRAALGERAWEAVWLLGGATTLAGVVDLARSDHTWTRQRALKSLARSPSPLTDAEMTACAEALSSPHHNVRTAAVHAVALQAAHLLPPSVGTRGEVDPVVAWWRRVGGCLRDPDSYGERGASAS